MVHACSRAHLVLFSVKQMVLPTLDVCSAMPGLVTLSRSDVLL